MTPDQIIEQEKRREAQANKSGLMTPADIIAREKSRLANSANGSFYVTKDVQPDRASKVISLADRIGAQPDFVDKNLETIEQGEEEQTRKGLLDQFPKVAEYFANPYRAAEAKDSVQFYAEIEKQYRDRAEARKPKGWLEAPFAQLGDLGRSFGGELVAMPGMAARGIGDVLTAYENTMRTGANMVPGLREGLAEIDRIEAEVAPGAKQFAPGNYLRTAGGGLVELGDIIKPENQGLEDQVAGAIGQIVGAVISTVTAGPAATAGLFMGMGADQQGQAMRQAGVNPDEKLPELLLGAGVTGLSEQMRLGSIMRAIPKEARDRVASKVLARIAGQAGEEAVQETVEGLGQNLITMGYDEEAKLLEGLGEQATVAGTASAVFQALVEVALPGKRRAAQAEQAAQELTDIRAIIEQTPVFQRSREAIETFLNEAGEGETVLLHGEDMVELFQSDPETFYQRMEEVGLTEEDVLRAKDGHDIEVEAAKVLSVAEGFEDWVKIVKRDPETPSLREMERGVEMAEQAFDFQEALERLSEQDEALEGFEQVALAIEDQVTSATGDATGAKAFGSIWGAMFRQIEEVSDGKLGAVETFKRLGIDVRGPSTPKQPRITKPQEPQTLHSFVRGLGGIRESFGQDERGHMRGEVDARLGERVPGLINNASGVTLDEIYRAATEEGGFDIRDEQELLDLLDRDLSGERVYPVGQGEVYAAELDAYEAQFAVPDGEVMNQNPPRSLFAAMKMDPQQRAEWYDRIIDESRVGNNTVLTIKADTQNMIFDDVVIVIQNGIDVEFTVEGQHADRGRNAPPENIAKGARVMAQSTAALQEWMLRNDSPFVGFTGATEAHNRLYESMLGRFAFDGYLGYKTNDYRAMLNVDAAGTKTADADPYDSAPGFMIVKDGYLEQAKHFLKSRQDGLTADATAFGEDGAGILTKRLGSTVPVESRSRRVGGPDQGRDGDGRGSGASGDGQSVSGSDVSLTPIEPAQRELFQNQELGGQTISTGLYSGVQRAAEALPDRRMRTKEALGRIAKGRGVSGVRSRYKAEMEALALDKAFADKEFITKQEVLDYIESAGVKISLVSHAIRSAKLMRMSRDDLVEYALENSEQDADYFDGMLKDEVVAEIIEREEFNSGRLDQGDYDLNFPDNFGEFRAVIETPKRRGDIVDRIQDLEAQIAEWTRDVNSDDFKPDFYGYARGIIERDQESLKEARAELGRYDSSEQVREKPETESHSGEEGEVFNILWSEQKLESGKKTIFVRQLQSDEAQQRSSVFKDEANDLRKQGIKPDRRQIIDDNYNPIPLVDSTSQWVTAAVRAITIQAANGRADSVAFPTGKTSAVIQNNNAASSHYDTNVKGAAEKLARQLGATFSTDTIDAGGGQKHEVYKVQLTPAIRRRLREDGLPLFQRQGTKPRASVLIPGGGVLTDQNVIVNLIKKNDRTSFMHESAHIFLELYAALESENEAIAERMGAIRKWLKIEPGEAITEDQHEKFAESFEAYLMEGVAPSAELRSVFHSFRQWFVDVYRRLRGQLRNLEPEARDIFDRMLASDTEIEMAQGQYVGTLSKVMQGIMDPEKVEKYQKHARKAGNVARDKLFKKHMAEVKRREKKAYKEEQGRVEDIVRAQLSEWPEYKALMAFTQGGRTLDAAETPEGTKLNTSENGEHPEIVAPEMGFTSADEMFKAVAKMPKPETIVRESVKEIMGDRYGDMLQDGTIESEAMEAVFNEPTIRMLEAERNAIAHEMSKQRPGDKKRGISSDTIPLVVIRKEADRLINSMPIDQVIKPGRYAIKARDLHKKSIRAAARGKWYDALRYTHQAMLQHELARRAFKARDEIEKANRYLAKFAAHRKLDPKKIAPEYIAKIRELMALPGAQDQTELRDGLNKFADEQAIDGHAVILPSDVVNGADLPLRRRMTMEQFREFRDGVKNLNKLGRMQSAEAQEQFNEEAQALADEIDENFKGKRIRETRNPTFGERRAANARQMDATIIRWPFLVESLQGGKIGKIVEAFDTRLRQALTNRNARRQDMADKLAEIFNKHGISQSELNKRVSAKAIEEGGVKFEQIMAVAMNMGTEQNRDRLASDPSMLGDMAAIEAMLAEHLEQRHWDATQEIWDLINTLWPEASAVERNATGVTPKKVEASSVQTKFGSYRGGYYPLKYDRRFMVNEDLKKKDEIEDWKNKVNSMTTRAATQRGFLYERQQNVERPLDLSLSVILSHIDDVTNDIYMREPASYVSRLLNKQRIRKVIKETQGDEYLKTLETILKRTVTGTERPDTAFEKLLQTMRINASVAILGANVVTAGLAPISYIQTVIPQYGFKTVFAGVAEYYSNPKKNAKLIAEKSAFMRERQDTLTREAHELIRKSAGQTQYAKFQGAGYWLMATAEKHSVSGPLWIGVYNDAKARGESEADAVTQADRAVSTTQGSGLEIDQSVMQGGNEGLRLLSFMWGYVSGYYGTVRNDVVSEQGLKKLMPLLKHMVILNLVASMMEAFIRGGFGDEEDPYVVAVWQMMMRNTFGLIPGVSSAVSKYDSGPAAFQVGTSVTRATENWAKAGTQLYEDGEAEGETVRRAMLETAKAGGFLFGVPGTVQAMKIEKTYAEDDDPTLYEAIVTGPDDDN